jgi:RNA-directed DNA polymerase
VGIPVLLDRAEQCLAKQALEPQWESRFEGDSYGFRPGRSPRDALEAIFLTISRKAKYVLDADIAGCFDHISQRALLTKLDTFPALRRTIKGWLEAGVVHEAVFSPTSSGVPQGGTISPLLMNVALHGMEQVVATSYGRGTSRPQLIRYADDLVVLHPELAGVQAARAALEQWLAGMGLELKPSKTRITHTLDPYEDQVGFDFLGCTIRQFRVGATQSGRGRNGQPLGFKTIIRPSKEAIQRHVQTLGDLIRKHRAVSQDDLIGMLNPRIQGWANYYRSVSASATFALCDSHLYHQLRRWCCHRHPTKPRRWIVAKYWRPSATRRWNFTSPSGATLRRHAQTPIRRHVKVRKAASLFDGNLAYWAQRLQCHPETGVTLGRLLRAQGGRCAACGLLFVRDDQLEIDHIQPASQAGGSHPGNLQVLHPHCHDRKTAREGAAQRAAGYP